MTAALDSRPVTTQSELPSLRLDATREEALERAAAIVAEAWRSFDRARSGKPPVDDRLRELLRSALPGDGSSAQTALDDAARILDESIAQPRPRFFAFVGSSGLEIGVLGKQRVNPRRVRHVDLLPLNAPERKPTPGLRSRDSSGRREDS